MKNTKTISLLALVFVCASFLGIHLTYAQQANYQYNWPDSTNPQDVQLTNTNADYNPFSIRLSDGNYLLGDRRMSVGLFVKKISSSNGAVLGSYQLTDHANAYIGNLAPDNNGGAYVTVNDTGLGGEVFLHHLDSNGTLVTLNLSSELRQDILNQGGGNVSPQGWNGQVVADGNNGVYAYFQFDYSNLFGPSKSMTEIGHYILNNGSLIPDPNWTGAVTSMHLLTISDPADPTLRYFVTQFFKSDGSNYVITARATPQGVFTYNIHFLKIDSNGNFTGFSSANPYALSTNFTYPTSGYQALSDNAGGVLLPYNSGGDQNHLGGIGFDRLVDNHNGTASFLYGTEHILYEYDNWTGLLSAGQLQAMSDNNHVFIGWTVWDDNLQRSKSYLQKLDFTGGPQWNNPGTGIELVSGLNNTDLNFIDNNVIVSDGNGGAIAIVHDFNNNNNVVQKVTSSGSLAWTGQNGGGLIFPQSWAGFSSLIPDGTGGVIEFWVEGDPSSNNGNIFGQHITDFANNNPQSATDTNATQNINCNNIAGSQNFEVRTPAYPDANTVGFQTRTTDFYNTTNASLDSNQFVQLYVSDDRGYDPSAMDCGSGHSYTIQSNGLYLNGNTSNQRLALRLGRAVGIGKFAWDTVFGPHSPINVSDVFNTDITTASADLSTAVQVTHTNEAFLGQVILTLDGSDLEVIKPAASIPAGNYSGTITFSQI